MNFVRYGILLLSLAFASGVMAEGTGPTQPDKARQHPLDNSEPVTSRPSSRGSNSSSISRRRCNRASRRSKPMFRLSSIRWTSSPVAMWTRPARACCAASAPLRAWRRLRE